MPLIQRRIVQGEPIRVGQREVMPEAQVTSWLQRRATIGMHRSSGWGVGRVSIRPLALVERGPMGTRRIPIRDETTADVIRFGSRSRVRLVPGRNCREIGDNSWRQKMTPEEKAGAQRSH